MSDAFRGWPALAALAAAAALALLLAFVARGVNRPPSITRIDVDPPTVARDASAVVRVTAEDPDGDALRFEYKAGAGRIVADDVFPHEGHYTPAATGGIADRLTIVIHDARGLSASSEAVVTIAGDAPPAPAAEAGSPPPMPVAPAAAVPPSPPPARPTRAATATATAPPAAATRPSNRAPVLQPGYPISGVGNNSVRVMATGHDPDDDEITHEWDTGGCFEILHQSATEAEVKFAEGCEGTTLRLIWTDPHGASASTEWVIRK